MNTTQGLPDQNPTAKEIVDALGRTGFILEYRVAQVLRAAGFETAINYAYPDPETRKSREVDIYAYDDFDYGDRSYSTGRVRLAVDLILECKNYTNPLILLGECGQEQDLQHNSLHISFDPLRFKFDRLREFVSGSVIGALKLLDLPGLRPQEDFVGTQLIRMNREKGSWKADNTGIYDGITYPLAKACAYRFQQEGRANGEDVPAWRYPGITYIFPIVVTAGPIFTVDVTTDNAPIVQEVAWTTLRRYFDSTDIKDDFFIDVVKFDRLGDYLESRTLKIIESARNAVAANLNLYDPEWLLTNCGEPRKTEPFNDWLEGVRTLRSRSALSWATGADENVPYRRVR